MRRSKLVEGMWAGDLADIVQPTVSIDEYASKIDSDSLVIGFYVSDEDAARDLNRFIQRSPLSMVDSEVSPAPDQRGFYMVFVELLNNDRIIDNISGLLDEVQPLASVKVWQMKVRNAKKMMRFDAKKLEKILDANRVADRIATIENTIKKLNKALAVADQKKEQIAHDKVAKAAKQDFRAKVDDHKDADELAKEAKQAAHKDFRDRVDAVKRS